MAAYASEINRLKAVVAKLQRMQFGKSSEKLREKTARQVREAEEHIGALHEEMAKVLGEQHDPVRYVLGHIQDRLVNRIRDLLPSKVDLTSG